ncbi:MAG TPA: hypothetical protein VF575_01680 [Candidatus Saccharimonadales bacterium]
MFLKFPFEFNDSVQQTALIVNTVLLIGALIAVELVYAESAPEQRKHLRLFMPLFMVLVGILLYAVIKQVGKS